jgi:hypothetical protein
MFVPAGFLLSLPFDLENEGHIIPGNVGLFPNQTVLHPRRPQVRNHSHENVKSDKAFCSCCL